MEELIKTRMNLFLANVESLIDTGQDMLIKLKSDGIDLDEAKIVSTKLKSAIDRFVAETYNYYKLVEVTSPDDLAKYTDIQIKGEELVTELNHRVNKKANSEPFSTFNTVEKLNVASKLPKMELAKFNGDVLKWHPFWDQFSSNVDSRNISEVDKLLYLQSVLEGEAKRAIEGLDMTNKNYQIAVSTLKERYGKPGTIIDAHYAALYRIRTADKSVADCRRVLNEIERHLRVLSSLGEDVSHNHLRVMIMQKFSEDLIYELRMKMGTETDSIENIRRHLEHIISAREASSRMKEETFSTEGSTSKEDAGKFTLESLHVRTENHRRAQSTFKKFPLKEKDKGRSYGRGGVRRDPDKKEYVTGYLKTKLNNGRKRNHLRDDNNYRGFDTKRRKPSCIFCGNGHFNDECDVVKTVEERKRKLEGRCYNCLSKGHISKECKSHKKCWHCSKYGEHNRALCPSRNPVRTENLHVGGSNNIKGLTFLQTAVAQVQNVEKESVIAPCRVILDSGSQRTYITKELAKRLNLPELEKNNLSVFTFGADRPTEIDSPVVIFRIITRTNVYKILYANVVPHITNSVSTLPREMAESVLGSVVPSNTILADDNSLGDNIDLLIGNDYYFTFIDGEKRKVTQDLYLINSAFGWIFSGRYSTSERHLPDKLSVLTYFQSGIEFNSFYVPDLPLKSDDMKRLWDLESIGIMDSPKVSREDEAVRQFNETTQYLNNRYYVKWPWVAYPPLLPSNYGLARGRLTSLLKRLDDDTIQRYNDIIQDQLERGIIEIVPDPSVPVEHPVHYLPHHCVEQNEKLRLVYDASSKTKGNKSLNECLYRGPLMLEDLTGLLIRFREHRIGIVADVEKAFLQVGLQNEDRDVTRFLWTKSAGRDLSPQNIQHYRFCRVPFGVISSPFLLNATIRHHLKRSDSAVFKQVAENIYVDNLVTGTDSVENAEKLYNGVKRAFDDLSMNIREWNSNSEQFNETIPLQFRSKTTERMKVLGLEWDLLNDMLKLNFRLDQDKVNQIRTKREILGLVASIFDPCGFVTPIVLPMKLYLQNLWSQKYDWDTELAEEALVEWQTACRQA
ncbi:uncharacterized protein LOC131849970 [Achroia grisella]|uniref:uncharacterized protein LOC131849970 n=1 Tax=Achroia grisella TaxID=688607 RepID=UPI0027D1F84E|nr:uncharacterized protein LOC131849970 [Achroia grisella]